MNKTLVGFLGFSLVTAVILSPPAFCVTGRSAPVDVRETFTEDRVGLSLSNKFLLNFVLIDDEFLTNNISRVVARLVSPSGDLDGECKVCLINDPLPIASSLPGRYIYISSGMLDVLENENELAAIIAHALAHVHMETQYGRYVAVLEERAKAAERERKAQQRSQVLRYIVTLGAFAGGVFLDAHYVSRSTSLAQYHLRSNTAWSVKGLALSSFVSAPVSASGGAMATAREVGLPERRVNFSRAGPRLFSPGWELGTYTFFQEVYLGYDDATECQADDLAIQYMDKAGYDPNGLISVLEKSSRLRRHYESNGYVSHFWGPLSRLEERLRSARDAINRGSSRSQ